MNMKARFIFISSRKEKILIFVVLSYLPFDFSHAEKKRKLSKCSKTEHLLKNQMEFSDSS